MPGKSKRNEILLESGTNELELLEFTISGNHFGINVSKVVEILQYTEVTPMPNANPNVEGIFKPRDTVMTVIDLPKFMGIEGEKNSERDIFIITNFNQVITAFHVHTVEGIHRISWDKIEKPSSSIYGGQDGLATGIARYDDRLIAIIDFEKILYEINPETGLDISKIKKLDQRKRNIAPIIVIEDSKLLMNMIKSCLEEAGYVNLSTFQNGKEAWDFLQHIKASGDPLLEHAHCIITDIEMPQMDGHRLLKLVKDDEFLKPLPVIVFSSLITEEMKIKGRSLGATDQISKPDIGRLVESIDKAVHDFHIH